MSDNTNSSGLKPRTLAVRAGQMRSAFYETSEEALYLNSGYVYSSAQEAADAFAGDKDRYVYSRYGNPTLSMLETRLAALEGAEACRVCATGMSAISRRLPVSFRQATGLWRAEPYLVPVMRL